jgi:ClpP class serine protease
MYDTPGGSATGVTDIAETIASINIPTISYAYGNMCSAGYLLGSQSDEMYCDRFSMVGDIGVKISFMDYSKYLAEAKKTPVRFRSGDLKGAGDQKFSLSKKEKAYIQEIVDHMAEVFYEIVSEARGVPVDYLHKSGITDGRAYVGTQSLEVGLVDGVKTFEEVTLLAIEKAEKFLDRSAGQGLYGS